MIKQIGKHNILISPFVAVKAWELDNVLNQDVVLLEEFSSSLPIPDTEVALDYVDYTTSPLGVNSDCDIALEQQDADAAKYEEGVSGSGLFNIESEERNADGTYKRLIYDQTYRAFYNQYRNPTQIFGLDNIDFSLGKTDRYIGNKFLMFGIPRNIMGDRIVAGTVKMYDTTMDDNVEIYDDSYGNLIVGKNLFSKIQEVRPLSNLLLYGSSSFICPSLDNPPMGIITIDAIQTYVPGDAPEITSSQLSLNDCVFDSSVTNSYYYIPYYYDGYISASSANSETASLYEEYPKIWDGTFQYYNIDNDSSIYHMFGFAPNTESYNTQSVINGQTICNQYLYFVCNSGVPTWIFGINGNSGKLIFGGYKTGSTSPVGDYINDMGETSIALGGPSFSTADYAISPISRSIISLAAHSGGQTSIDDQSTCVPT